MKLWWRFRTTTSLWSSFLRAKYCQGKHPALVTSHLQDSPNWKRLLLASPLTEPYIRWMANTGNLSFWYDCWVGECSLASFIDFIPCTALLVKDVWIDGHWNIPMLHTLLPSHLVDAIAAISLDLSCCDVPYWTLSRHGTFTLTSAWHHVHVPAIERPYFAYIWHASIPLKISFFMWRLFHSWLPLDVILQGKGIPLASKCQCCTHVETSDHCFFFSSKVSFVWHHYAHLLGIVLPTQGCPKVWLIAWLNAGTYKCFGHIRVLIPILIFWFLWNERNDSKHRGMGFYEDRIIWKIDRLIFQLSTAGLLKHWQWRCEKSILNYFHCSSHTPPLSLPRPIHWVKPARGRFKLNVDGSFNASNGRAGGGGIVRDSKGQVIFFFFLPFLSIATDAFAAEVLTLHKALQLGLEFNIQNLWVEMDALSVIQLLQHKGRAPWHLCYHFKEIHHMLASLRASLTHIHREGNHVADFLAGLGLQAPSLAISNHFEGLSLLRGKVRLDALGFANIRYH